MTRLQAWLEIADGARLRIGVSGLVAGRSGQCDVVLESPGASRKHALFVATPEGVMIIALGQKPVHVNGRAERTQTLQDGDQVDLPGFVGVVRIQPRGPTTPSWVLRVAEARIGVPTAGLRIGPTADATLEGWEGMFAVTPVGMRLRAVCDRDYNRNGVRIAPGEEVGLLAGDQVDLGDGVTGIEITREVDDVRQTRPDPRALANSVRLETLPRGGRLHVTLGGQELSVYLPERRFAMVASLLQPPDPLAAGDLVPDEVLLRQVWPRVNSKSRVDLNVLIRRLRTDLEGAGIPARIVVRGGGGGSTRFVVGPGTTVSVEA